MKILIIILKLIPYINCENSLEQYKYDSIVIMQCPGNKDVSVAEGEIKDIENNLNIIHSVSTDNDSSGSPIILSNRNLNIIGIHQGNINQKNKGVYFKIVLEDLEKQYFSNINFIGTYDYEGKIFENCSLEIYKKNNEKR